MKPVDLRIRWHELFGEIKGEMPDDVRRQRWEEWKALCSQQPDGKEIVKTWIECDEACLGCIHRLGDWCNDQQLPCTVNPILTFTENLKGMACMGLNYKPGQMNMF